MRFLIDFYKPNKAKRYYNIIDTCECETVIECLERVEKKYNKNEIIQCTIYDRTHNVVTFFKGKSHDLSLHMSNMY